MTPAQAIGWELWRRHRRGFLGLGVYLVVLAAIKLTIIARGLTVVFDNDIQFAFAVMVPISCSIVYLVAVFTYGLSGDVAARQSMYPARMFTLPVSNAALVGWPMFYGAATIVVFWAATRWLATWPSNLAIPTFWPSALAAALILWTQAATWMPYPFPGARLIAAVLVLQAIDAVVMIALYAKSPEWVILAITLPQLPLAYLTARYAIARARRGDVPDWSLGAVIPSAAKVIPSRASAKRVSRNLLFVRGAFPSPTQAQAWFEWKRHGRALPVWVAIVLPFVLLLLWTAGTSTALVVATLLTALVTPVVMALFSGVTVARSGSASDWFGLPPFSAVRPLTNGQLLAAKLKMTMWSTFAAWSVVAVAIPIALAWSRTWPIARDFGRHMASIVGTPRAVALLLFLVAALMLSTWRQLVQSLYIGLTGNERLIKGSMFASIVLASILGPLVIWIVDAERLAALWSMMPLILGALVAAKMGAAAWVAVRLTRARTLSDRALLTGAITWTATVLALFGVLAWLADTPHIPRFLVMLIAILSVPLARISAATLAVQQNRHR
jgi:hypothetical protein